MRKLVALIGLLMTFELPGLSQETYNTDYGSAYGYTSIDYDPSTGQVTAYSETDIDPWPRHIMPRPLALQSSIKIITMSVAPDFRTVRRITTQAPTQCHASLPARRARLTLPRGFMA